MSSLHQFLLFTTLFSATLSSAIGCQGLGGQSNTDASRRLVQRNILAAETADVGGQPSRERVEDGDPSPMATGIGLVALWEEAPAAEAPRDYTLGSLAAIEAQALKVNPAILQALAEVDALKGKHLQAGLLPNPIAGISGDDINEDGGGGRYGVYYGRTIVRGGKLHLAQSVVRAEIEAANLRIEELQQRLKTDVRQRYFDLLVAVEKTKLANRLVKLSENAFVATETLVGGQELARTALLQAKLELQNARVTERRAQNEVMAARRKLAVLIDEPDLPFDSVEGSLTDDSSLEDIEVVFDRIMQTSPEIAKLFADVHVARRQLNRQRAEPISNISWQTGLEYDTVSDDVVSSFQVGVTIPTLNRNQGAISEACHQIVAREQTAQRKALELREKLVTAYQLYRDAKLQVDALRADILPTASETLELINTGYRQGEVGFLELLTAQRTYFQISLENIQQLRQMWRQRIVIEGLLLSDNLQQ